MDHLANLHLRPMETSDFISLIKFNNYLIFFIFLSGSFGAAEFMLSVI